MALQPSEEEKSVKRLDRTGPPEPTRGAETQAGVRDMRAKFAKKGPETAADRDRARAFIEGKIQMVRSDPSLSDEQKDAAIAEMKARR